MAQPPELTGHVLGGKYRLVRAVSEGPRQVHEARHDRFSGRFAVKLWPSTTPWEAFWRGAELAMTLRHPGVMQTLDFNCQPGVPPFLVLEWVDGTRLSDIISEAGLMPIERVAPLIESAAWAIASAHQQGVVHLELRPDEVFVVHAPGTMREWVKVAGFGVSAALARAGTAPPSRYRAPEQKSAETGAHDDGDDPQSDQYSLATIAYEMLAGIPPFHDEGTQAEPAPISDLAPGVTPAVDAAVRQALAVDPEQRFAGVLEFARALRDAIDGASPEALRRRSAAANPRDRRARVFEAVSPFFNPLQGRASEVFRRVATTTARLRTLAARTAPRVPGGPAARIAIAGAALLVAVTGTSLVLRQRAPTHGAPAAPAPVAAATPPPPRPAAPPPMLGPPPPRPEEAAAAPSPTAAAPRLRPPPASRTRRNRPTPRRRSGHPRRPGSSSAGAARPSRSRPSRQPRSRPSRQPRSRPSRQPRSRPSRQPRRHPCHPARRHRSQRRRSLPRAARRQRLPRQPPARSPPVRRPRGRVARRSQPRKTRTPIVRFPRPVATTSSRSSATTSDLYQMEIITLRAGAPFKKVYPLQ